MSRVIIQKRKNIVATLIELYHLKEFAFAIDDGAKLEPRNRMESIYGQIVSLVKSSNGKNAEKIDKEYHKLMLCISEELENPKKMLAGTDDYLQYGISRYEDIVYNVDYTITLIIENLTRELKITESNIRDDRKTLSEIEGRT